MARPKADRENGSTQAGQLGAEQPAGDGAEQAPPDGGLDAAARAGLAAMAPPQDEPGPEDFDRHTGARLIAEHETDLQLEIDVQRRIRNRAPVIAARAIASGAKNPVVHIGARLFAPRKRPEKDGGGIGLAEIRERTAAVI